MGLITKGKTWADNEKVNYNELNNDFDTLYTEFNGNIDDTNIKSAAGINKTKIAGTAVTFTEVDTDGTLAANSDVKVASQKAVKTYVDSSTLSSKLITASRDAADASGDVSYTGVGFTPSSITFYAGLQNTSFSIGSCDSSKAGGGIFWNTATNIGEMSFNLGSSVIYLGTGAGAAQKGVLKSFDADGFTITWTKSGSPTGTINVTAICYK